jgi:hypothetical protein
MLAAVKAGERARNGAGGCLKTSRETKQGLLMGPGTIKLD